jgi:hypothetical protein
MNLALSELCLVQRKIFNLICVSYQPGLPARMGFPCPPWGQAGSCGGSKALACVWPGGAGSPGVDSRHLSWLLPTLLAWL